MSVNPFYLPSCSLFGFQCLEGLSDEIKRIGCKKGLIITDKSLINLGIIKKVTNAFDQGEYKYDIYDEVRPNPTVTTVENGLERLKSSKCDFVVSVGGGSAHDCAKAIAVLATNGGTVEDYKGLHKSKVKPLPIVAINTTAGTASECTHAYVILDEKTNTKLGIRDSNVLATIAVNDHDLMMQLPPALTAGTGMDALTHAIECYTSNRGFTVTRALAISAIRLIFTHLKAAVKESTVQSREGMAAGQYIAGLAFGNSGTGMVHAMSHQLSAFYDLPHGLCNAVLLPEVLKFNCKSESAIFRYQEIAQAIFPMETVNMDARQAAELLIEKVEQLSQEVGTSVSLGSLGVEKEKIDVMSEKALLDGSLKNNPVQPQKEQVKAIYSALL